MSKQTTKQTTNTTTTTNSTKQNLGGVTMLSNKINLVKFNGCEESGMYYPLAQRMAKSYNTSVWAISDKIINNVSEFYSTRVLAAKDGEKIATTAILPVDNKVLVINSINDYTKVRAEEDKNNKLNARLPRWNMLKQSYSAVVFTANFIHEARDPKNAEYRLDWIMFPCVVVFKQRALVNKEDVVMTNKIERALRERVAKNNNRGKKRMYSIININAGMAKYEGTKRVVRLDLRGKDRLELQKVITKVSESRLTELFVDANIENPYDSKLRYFENILVYEGTAKGYDAVDLKPINSDVLKDGVEVHIITDDYEINGTFNFFLKTSSQDRQAKCFITSLDVENAKMLLANGYNYYGTKVFSHKANNSIATATSGSKPIMNSEELSQLTIKVIPDEFVSLGKVRFWEVFISKIVDKCCEFDAEEKEEIKEHQPTDGQFYGTLKIFAKKALVFCKINNKEYSEIMHVFCDVYNENLTKMFANESNNKALMGIMKKIMQSSQDRMPGVKGNMILFDNKGDGNVDRPELKDSDIILHESVVKGPEFYKSLEDNTLWLRTINYAKQAKGQAQVNYQFLFQLDISKEEFAKVVGNKVEEIMELIYSEKSVFERLGLIRNACSLLEDDTLTSKVATILLADRDMYNTLIVQSALKQNLLGLLRDSAKGRWTVKGNYAYIIMDPRFVFDKKNCLKANEFCYGDREGVYGLFRSPAIYDGASVKVTFIKTKLIPYLTTVIIFNPYDMTLLILSGADVDGDKVLCTNEPWIINNMKCDNRKLVLKRSIPEDMQKKLRTFTLESEREDAIQAIAKSSMGVLVNSATATIDKFYSQRSKLSASVADAKLEKLMAIFEGACQYVIDAPKKLGYNITISKSLLKAGKEGIPEYAAKTDKARTCDSKSFIQDGFNYVKEYLKKDIDAKLVENGSIYDPFKAWGNVLDLNVVTELTKVFRKNTDLVSAYNKEVYKVIKAEEEELLLADDEDESQAIKAKYAEIYEEIQSNYKSEIYTLSRIFFERNNMEFDTKYVAAAIYRAAYNNRMAKIENKTKLTGWSIVLKVMWEEFIDLLQTSGRNTRYVAVETADKYVIINNIGTMYDSTGVIAKRVVAPEGTYEVKHHGEEAFIYVQKRVVVEERDMIIDKNFTKFHVSAEAAKGTGKELIEALKAAETVEIILLPSATDKSGKAFKKTAIVVDHKVKAKVNLSANEALEIALTNKRINVVSGDVMDDKTKFANLIVEVIDDAKLDSLVKDETVIEETKVVVEEINNIDQLYADLFENDYSEEPVEEVQVTVEAPTTTPTNTNETVISCDNEEEDEEEEVEY